MSGEDSNTLADIRRVMEVGLVAVNGRLDVIIERLEHQDRRADAHESQLASLDTRLDSLERHGVTHQQMDNRQKRTLGWVSVIVSLIGILVGAVVSVVIAVFL